MKTDEEIREQKAIKQMQQLQQRMQREKEREETQKAAEEWSKKWKREKKEEEARRAALTPEEREAEDLEDRFGLSQEAYDQASSAEIAAHILGRKLTYDEGLRIYVEMKKNQGYIPEFVELETGHIITADYGFTRDWPEPVVWDTKAEFVDYVMECCGEESQDWEWCLDENQTEEEKGAW